MSTHPRTLKVVYLNTCHSLKHTVEFLRAFGACLRQHLAPPCRLQAGIMIINQDIQPGVNLGIKQ